jgi:lysophospholipase L1-like esterase
MAVENIYKITVNMKTKMFRQVPEIVANDNVVFEIEVWDDATLFPLLPEHTYRLVSLKKSKTSVIRDGALVDGLIRFELGTSEMTEPGKVEATVQIYDVDNNRISSAKFDYTVKGDPSLNGSLPADDTSLVIANESLLTEAIEKADNADARITNILSAAAQPSEVVDARGGKPVLKARLDAFDASLAERVKKVNNVLPDANGNVTIPVPQVDTSTLATKTELNAVASGSPKGVYATLTALQTAFPTGNTNIYLVTADGKWYYWNGSAWTAGGTYQATGVPSITPAMTSFLAEDHTNLVDISKLQNGYLTNGVKNTDANSSTSDYMPAVEGQQYSTNAGWGDGVAYYDVNKTYVAKATLSSGKFTVPAGQNIVYMRASWGSSPANNTNPMVVKGATLPGTYVPYSEYKLTISDTKFQTVIDSSVDSKLNAPDFINKIPNGSITVDKTSFLKIKHTNLVDLSMLSSGYINSSTGAINNDANSSCSDFIPVTEGMTYNMNADNNNAYYRADKTYISQATTTKPFTVPTGQGIAYIRISWWNTPKASLTNGMMVEGSVLPASYVPYSEYNVVVSDNKVKDGIIKTVNDYNAAQPFTMPDKSVTPAKTSFLRHRFPNLIDPTKTVNGYIGSNGAITGAGLGVYASDFIPITEGMTYITNGSWQSGYYNASKVFVQNFTPTSVAFTVPTGLGIAYMRIGGIGQSTGMAVEGSVLPSNYVSYQDPEIIFSNDLNRTQFMKYLSRMNGLKLNALGDSITQGTGASDPNNTTWLALIAKEKGLIARNYGIAGTRITRKDSSTNHMAARYTSMSDDADIILVAGGTNDGDVPMGVATDTTEDTFYGACNVLFNGLCVKYPGKRIGIITPLKYKTTDSDTGNMITRVNILKEVAAKYSLPILDLFNAGGLCFDLTPAHQSQFTIDGLHPNDAGYVVMARRISAFVETL